jgi:hypothetical protein
MRAIETSKRPIIVGGMSEEARMTPIHTTTSIHESNNEVRVYVSMRR